MKEKISTKKDVIDIQGPTTRSGRFFEKTAIQTMGKPGDPCPAQK